MAWVVTRLDLVDLHLNSIERAIKPLGRDDAGLPIITVDYTFECVLRAFEKVDQVWAGTPFLDVLLFLLIPLDRNLPKLAMLLADRGPLKERQAEQDGAERQRQASHRLLRFNRDVLLPLHHPWILLGKAMAFRAVCEPPIADVRHRPRDTLYAENVDLYKRSHTSLLTGRFQPLEQIVELILRCIPRPFLPCDQATDRSAGSHVRFDVPDIQPVQ